MTDWDKHSRPEMDHGVLSPSGRVSKRARKAKLAIEAARLFPPGFWDKPVPTAAQEAAQAALQQRRHATRLTDLANRGMHPRKYKKEAARALAEAKALEAEHGLSPQIEEEQS
ncbi:hypothetical protein LCGC14_0334860 [marine sediment metagenome]|uniref:Uncharacterized protein n=1 Tax=marine sediment metagenome TaxID=412755 RepID=A0A0F9WMW8_9ZZZZ